MSEEQKYSEISDEESSVVNENHNKLKEFCSIFSDVCVAMAAGIFVIVGIVILFNILH